MASVYERSNGKWLVAYRAPCPAGTLRASGNPVMVRRNKVISAKSKKDALRQARQIEVKAQAEKPIKQSDGTLGWFINSVYLKHQQATKAVKTAHRDAQLGAAVIRLLGSDVPIKEIDEDTFDALIAAARAELWPEDHPSKAGQNRNGARQVHHLWSFLKRTMAFACKKKHVSFNVKMAMLDAPSVPKRGPNVKYASAGETHILVDGLRNGHGTRKRTNPDLADVVQLGFLQALRKQETLGLRWANVFLDVDVPYINVVDVVEEAGGLFRLRTGTKTDTKTGQLGRKVFLLPEAIDLLRRRQGGTNNALVFPDPNTGDVWRPSAVSSMVRTAAKNLGVTAGLHSRRHGGITALLEAGVPLEVVSKHAGHANTDMTETTYGWITDDLAKQQVAQITSAQKTPTGELPADVMKLALDYAIKSGEPLDQVLETLRGLKHAAE